MKKNNTKTMVTAGLMAAFTCIATMIIQIPTPTMGYVHMGDSLVILSGIILGPVLGGFTAGLGSMLADLLSGYAIYVIPTFVIKFVCAFLSGTLFYRLKKLYGGHTSLLFITAGLFAEINMVFGYALNKLVQTMFLAGSYSGETFGAGLANAVAGLFPDSLQGLTGIVIGLALFPILSKVPDIALWMNERAKKTGLSKGNALQK